MKATTQVTQADVASQDLFPRQAMIVSARYISVFLARYGYILAGFVCVLLGYLLVWHRGLYLDDYLNRITAVTPTGHRTPLFSSVRNPVYPAREGAWVVVTLTADLLTNYELLVRVPAALGIGINAFLLGWLVHRMIGSRLAAIVSGWLFLMPFYAYEALLWAGANTSIVVTFLALVFLHACWSALASLPSTSEPVRSRVIGWVLLATAVCALMLLFAEVLVVIIGLAPLLGLVVFTRRRRPSFSVILTRAIAVFVGPLGVVAFIYERWYHSNTAIIAGHGGADLSLSGIVQRAPQYSDRLQWLTVSDQWGRHFTRQVFAIGHNTLLQSWKGSLLFACACVLIGLTALVWKTDARDYEARYGTGIVILLIGVIWFVTAILFPSVLVKAQYLEYRSLYFPFAGASMALGAAVWLIVKVLRRTFLERVFIVVIGGVLLLSTVIMVGFQTAFASRYQLDQKEITAFTRHVSAQDLPAGSILIPYALNERLPVKGPAVNLYFDGVFEAPWSANAEINRVYHRTDLIAVVTNRWVGMRFAMGPDETMLNVQGVPVPIDRAVVFTYQNGDVQVIENLVIRKADGSQRTVVFPLAIAMGERGVPTIGNVLVESDTPMFTVVTAS